MRPRFARNFLTLQSEGAGNAGRSMRPQPRMQNKNEHTSVVTTVTPETPGIPYAMVYDLFRALPGDRACLSPSLAVTRKLDAGVEASGPHDFAVRSQHRTSARCRVHRIPFQRS